MPELAKKVTIDISEDGKFKLESDTGNVLNYTEKELVKVLEEVVNQFRGNQIKIPKVITLSETGEPVSPIEAPKTPPVPRKQTIDADAVGEEYYNGGLGPRIGSGTDSGFGRGV